MVLGRLGSSSPAGTPQSAASRAWPYGTPPVSVALCVQELSPKLAAGEEEMRPGYSSVSLAGTAGIIMLVGGVPDQPSSEGSGSSGSSQPQSLPPAVQAELSASWRQLRQLLERIAPEVRLGFAWV